MQTKYWSQSHNLDFTVYLPKKFEINNEVHADLRQKTAAFNTDNDAVVWNGYIGRKFLKNDKGLLKFYVYDLLNQNKGYDRQINTNVITEKNYETITPLFHVELCVEFFKIGSRFTGTKTIGN